MAITAQENSLKRRRGFQHVVFNVNTMDVHDRESRLAAECKTFHLTGFLNKAFVRYSKGTGESSVKM